MDIKSEKELIEWVYAMHLQNLSGREDFTEAFKDGIEATIEELKELKFSANTLHSLILTLKIKNNESKIRKTSVTACTLEILHSKYSYALVW